MKNSNKISIGVLTGLLLLAAGCGQGNFTIEENVISVAPVKASGSLERVVSIAADSAESSKHNSVQSLALNIQGLSQATQVSATVKNHKGFVIGTIKAHANQRIDLSSLELERGQTYTVVATAPGYKAGPVILNAQSDSETILAFEKLKDDLFTYHWESDLKDREYEYSSVVPAAPQIEFLDEAVDIPNHGATIVLKNQYNIILSNEEMDWGLYHANALLRTIMDIPHNKIALTKFILSDKQLPQDIKIEERTGNYIVTLSAASFNYANPRMVRLEGVRGRFFSKRLFQALARFITDNGRNENAVAKIMEDKFGVVFPSGETIESLTGEHRDRFQEFQYDEKIALISTLVEMPKGYHKILGLRYLIRRRNGHPHPLYPDAAAVAWPRGADVDSYIEFMDKAFEGNYSFDLHRLILHEKAHFFWRNIFSDDLKTAWIDLGGWSQVGEEWTTTQTTQFVSPYAHAKNPNEDMAESMAFYILNPNKLRSVASDKFEFIKDNIMHGHRYVAQVRSDLQFEVLNLFRDYDYPGKIKRVDIKAYGDENQEKRVVIEIELLNKPGLRDKAAHARTRIYSDNDTFVDMIFYPKSGDSLSHILVGEVIIPALAKSGYWWVEQITIEDETQNRRMEGVNDFGFKLFINNGREDLQRPEYIENSLSLEVENVQLEGRRVHKVTATWDIDENMEMQGRSGVYAALTPLDAPNSYSLKKYGNVSLRNNQARVVFYVTEYFPQGRYAITYLNMQDKALNRGKQYFSADPKHEAIQAVFINTANPDNVEPVLNVSVGKISLIATPTNLDAPNGQTRVQITYYARDDKSGLDRVAYSLVDPLGKIHNGYHYHSNFYTTFFRNGDPTIYKKYVITHTLPRGSAAGTWGLKEISLRDKGGNSAKFNFEEILHFSVDR